MTDAPWDAGLQNERTTMAWVRSAMAFVALGMLLARESGALPLAAATLAITFVVAGSMVVTAERRHHARTTGPAGEGRGPVTAPFEVAVTALTAVAMAVVALALVAG